VDEYNFKGLGSTSPRPSPPDDKSLAFPMSSLPNQGQPLSPYDPYQNQPLSTSLPQSHQHSAFASMPSIHDSYRRQNQQLSYLSQSPQSGLTSQLGAGAQQLQQSQQFGAQTLVSPQPYQVVSQGALTQLNLWV
jgi:hypothetical protein